MFDNTGEELSKAYDATLAAVQARHPRPGAPCRS
jgi:hypothetical protein